MTGGFSDYGPSFGLTTLAERTRYQCCFPLWSNKARPIDADYGRVCGATVSPHEPGERARSYCAHHERVVTGSRAEKQKAKRIVRATVRQARFRGVA